MSTRIDAKFAELKAQGRPGFVSYIMSGDPNMDTSLEILKGLPAAGADIIELGMCFTDPMADGVAIQLAAQRALKSGKTLPKTLEMVQEFRKEDRDTPLILMGYYNPIYIYGVDRFLAAAKAAGVDGLIVVDLPPEEDDELCIPANEAGMNFIRLATPTTDEARLPAVLSNTSGFVYYVSITGITGAASATQSNVEAAVARLKKFTDLPIAVGFGINTPEQIREIGTVADAAVVGSAIVRQIENNLDDDGNPKPGLVDAVLEFTKTLSQGVR